MRRPLAVPAALLAFGLAALVSGGSEGCRKREDAPPPAPRSQSVERIPRTKPVDPSAPMHLAKPDEARVLLDLAAVRAAVGEYRQLNSEKNPPDLATLSLKLSFPADLVYDPKSGIVKSRTYPAY